MGNRINHCVSAGAWVRDREIDMTEICEGCGSEFTVEFEGNDVISVECPKCGLTTIIVRNTEEANNDEEE